MFTEEEQNIVNRIIQPGSRFLRLHRRVINLYEDEICRYLGKPKAVELETVAGCNARCSMCWVPKMERTTGVMSDDLFTKLLDDLMEIEPEVVCPFNCGEPLLDKKILERIEEIGRRLPHARLVLFTNAALLDEEKIRRVFALNVASLNISFNAGARESYERIMGLDYDRVMENIHRVIELNTGATIGMSFIRVEENKGEEPLFREMCRELGVEARVYEHHDFGGRFKLTSSYRFRRAMDFIMPPAPCGKALGTMTILVDGRVALCCRDCEGEEILGDAKEKSLLEVWNSERGRELRKLMLLGRRHEIPLCRLCPGH